MIKLCTMTEKEFKIESPFEASGDQPQAIEELCQGLINGEKISSFARSYRFR